MSSKIGIEEIGAAVGALRDAFEMDAGEGASSQRELKAIKAALTLLQSAVIDLRRIADALEDNGVR